MAKEQLVFEALPDCDPQIGRMLWQLEDTRILTQRTLEVMNPLLLDWQPEANSHSIGTLLYHIAMIEADWLYNEVLEAEWPAEFTFLFPQDVHDEQGRLSIVKGQSWDEHWSRLNHVRTRVLNTYKGMTLDDFRRARSLPDYDVTPEWVLHHLCQHEAEHRSEMAALRTMGEGVL